MMRLMIIDGNSIVNRAFFGVRSLNAPDGTPTNAIYGFLNILYRLVNTYNPDSMAIAFDVHAPTFRHKACDFYKANRKGMPDDLKVQMPLLKNILSAMNITIIEKEGYEADDILGTVSKICEDNETECIIVTGDRDSLQLVGEFTSVCLVKNNEDILYTPKVFADEYGFDSKGIIDLKALMGDSSDNIPGVPGVGEKTALALIQKYTDIDTVFKNIDTIDVKEGMRKKLRDGEESARTSYWLATIFRDVPLDIELNTLTYEIGNYSKDLYPILKNLALFKIIDKWKIEAPDVIEDVYKTSLDLDLPDDLTVTDNLKKLYKDGFEGNAFDTTIAQYLINPTLKEYDTNVSVSSLISQLKDLDLYNLYYDIELPLTKVLASMENKGILIDKEALISFGEELKDEISVLENNIYFQAGCEFNLNSPKQLSEVLFDKLKLPDKKKRSTAAEVLNALMPFHPIIEDILDYRELSKLKNTYTDGLQNYIAEDGRIHTSFQQTVTATGRLSSTDPNLQNIPIRKELGSKLREMFIAPPGKVLIDADYSQIELRLLAHIANDANMIAAFNSGEDFHRSTASKMFNIPIEEITASERSKAKAINFGIIYGMSAFTLANDLHVTNSEAKAYMDSYFEKFSSVASYMKEIVEKAKSDGYVKTLFGRRRSIPELASSNFMTRQFGERIALNMPIQGTAADIIKIAMNKVFEEISELDADLILQVHDELILECPEDKAEEISKILRDSMSNVVQLKVPLLVEVGTGNNWAKAH